AELKQGMRQLAAQTAGKGDEAFVMRPEQLEVDPRLDEMTFDVSQAGQTTERLVPLQVLGQQGEVMGAAVPVVLGASLLEAGAGNEVGLEADDGLHPLADAGLVELDGAVHVAVVGDRQGRSVG